MKRIQQIGWALVIATIIFSLVITRMNKLSWSRYSVGHHCHEIGHQSGSNALRRTVYSCDGGQIIVR